MTGSTSGIGWGIANQFAKAGARVMVQGLEKEGEISGLLTKLESISASKEKNRVAYTQADLSSEDACNRVIKRSAEIFGNLDILVNNAGMQFTSRTEDYPTEKWDAVMKINLYAPFFLSRAALPGMYKKGWGRLVHIASAHGLRSSPNKSAYCASKHGLVGEFLKNFFHWHFLTDNENEIAGMSKSIALESAGTGVTSNCICPGYALTPLVQKQIDNIAKEKGISEQKAKDELLLQKHPVGVFVMPENLGALAVFLSTGAADQVNGAALSMDVGWTAR